MAQNIYDQPDFFADYSQLLRSREGLAGAPEWPAVRSLLPASLDGLDIVDLGCGFGAFCRFAHESGAASIIGLDLSESMLGEARTRTQAPEVRFQRADLETLDLAPASADLIYSALALHYLPEVAPLFRTIRQALRPGGRLVFTVEHPIYTAPSHPRWIEVEGRPAWPIECYAEEGARITNWLAQGVVKHHRTVGGYVNALVDTGFEIRRLIEWAPSDEELVQRPDLASERRRPTFMLLAAQVP